MAERRSPSAWTTVDRVGAWYIVLNVVFWWGPLVLLATPSWLWTAVVLGLARDAVIGAFVAVVWLRRRAAQAV
jgi:hypothetical protein